MKFSSKPGTLVKSWIFNTLATLIMLLCLIWVGIAYGRYQVKQWLNEQNATIHIDSWGPGLNEGGFLSLVINKAKITFTSQQSSIKNIEFDKANMGLNFWFSLKSFLCAGELPIKIQNIKINFADQKYIKSALAMGKIVRRRNFYALKEIVVEPLQFGVREFNYEKQNYQLYHVIFYRVEGEINYQIDTHLIELLMEVPQAPLQMPEDKIYSFKIEGKAYQLAQQELEVPFKGKLFLKIKGLSNFLSHLHHIGVVSAIEQNLASMMIGASSKEPISAFEKKNDVTLTIKLQPDSVCIGPLKVYP